MALVIKQYAKTIFLTMSLIIAVPIASSNEVNKHYKVKVLFTNPECNNYVYPATTYQRGNPGKIVIGPLKNSYCTQLDAGLNLKGRHIEELKYLLSHRTAGDVNILYFRFSSKEITDLLCDSLSNGPEAKVHIFLDVSGYLDESKRLQECLFNAKRSVKITKIGGLYDPKTGRFDNVTGNFHTKLISFPISDGAAYIFGGGNPTKGISINHDNWVFIRTEINSNFSLKHRCFIQALNDFGDDYLIGYNKNCKNINYDDNLKVTTYILPAEIVEAKREFDYLFNNSTQIDMISQGFNNSWIKGLINKAIVRGVKVNIIADDDLFWVGNYSIRPQGATYMNRLEEWKNFAQKIYNYQLIFKYIQTSHFVDGNIQHNKFIIFKLKSGGVVVYTGSANFTQAAFSVNTEQVYLIKENLVTLDYVNQFSKLWAHMSLYENELPDQDLEPTISH